MTSSESLQSSQSSVPEKKFPKTVIDPSTLFHATVFHQKRGVRLSRK